MTQDAADTVTFTLNGREAIVRADHPHLLAALREELDVTSAKDGCSPTGQCGCCTVIIDGKAQVSCQLPLGRVAGRSVITVEGLDSEERQAAYITAALETGDADFVRDALGLVARARGMGEIAKNAGLNRESLYKALGESGNPEFSTIMRVVRALGLTLSARSVEKRSTSRRRRVA